MDLGLLGVPALVCGASKGLGYAVAHELAKEGANVAICSRDEAAISHAAAEIATATGASIHPIPGDLSAADDVRRVVASAAEMLGGIQVLITNAGGPPAGAATTPTDEEWIKAFETNCMSTVRLVRESLPLLRTHDWGRIVAITSYGVRQPLPFLVLSNAARSAVTAFLKTLSFEVGVDNITVNAVLPGQILTDRLRTLAGAPVGAGADDPTFTGMAQDIPLRRLGRPDEFSAVVAFLSSERASFVNGVSLQVDGGLIKSLL